MHRLRCFGRLAIENDGGERIQLRSRKHLALLVYLAAHRDRLHERGRVARLFWDTEPDLARHSLSQALYDLGKHLPGLDLDRTNREVGLGPDGLIYEGQEFEEAVREDRLGEAVRLYDGPFAPDLETVGGPDLERWVERERTRFRSLAEKALLRRVTECADAGRWGEMVVAGNRLVDMNPLREKAHRAVMKGLWLRGDRSAALAHFEEHEDFLDRESPGGIDAETRELVEKIRTADRDDGTRSVHERPRPEMVGREEEFRVLKDALDDVLDGESRFIVIRGEAGIGKTRLLEEFAEVAALEDVRLLESRCYAAESDVPYGPIVDGLKELAEEVAELAEAEDRKFYQLGHLFPEAFGEPEHDEIYSTLGALTRRLTEEFMMFLRFASRETPLVWLIDDSHWLDRTSRSLISTLAARLNEQPVAVIQAYRPYESTASAAGSNAEDSASWQYVDMTALSRLSLQQLMTQSVSGPGPKPTEVDRLLSLSGGNPFYALEVLKHHEELEQDDDSRFTKQEQSGIAANLGEILEARLDKHSAEEIHILQAIAVAGRQSHPRLIAAATGLSLEKLGRVSSNLYQSGVICDKQDSLVFKHDLLRHYVYASAGSLTRSAMHLAIAEALETHGEAEPASLAKHYAKAGESKKAFRYAYTAGKKATEGYAPQEAIEFLSLAVDNASSEEDRAKAQSLHAKVLFGTGRLEAAISTSEQALTSETLSSSETLDLRLLQSRALIELGAWKRAENVLRNLQPNEFDESPLSRLKLRWAHYLLLKRAVRSNDREQADNFLDYIEDIETSLDLKVAVENQSGNGLSAISIQEYTLEQLTIGGYNLFYQDIGQADSVIREIRPLIPRLPFELRQQVYSLGSLVASRLADWDRAAAYALQGGKEAEERNDKWALTMAYLNRSVIEMERGQFGRAEKLIQKCKDAGSLGRRSNHRAIIETNVGDQSFYTENYREALGAYETAIEIGTKAGFSYLLPELYASLGLTLLAEGRSEEAKEVSARIEPGDFLGGVQDRFKVYWLQAYWHARQGDKETLRTLRDRAGTEYRTDIPSAVKSQWIADLFEAELFSSNGNTRSAEYSIKPTYLKNKGLGWFAYHSRRWLQRVTAKN